VKAVDLFCGAGGASLGLHRAGYDAHGYDHWQPAVDTHNANGLPATLLDLSTDDPPLPDGPYLMWASPPCQPFSAAGNGDGEFDGRDGFPWLHRILTNATNRPAVLIVENVKGLTFATHQEYFATVLAGIRSLGYRLDWCVLNTADLVAGAPKSESRNASRSETSEAESFVSARWLTGEDRADIEADIENKYKTGSKGYLAAHEELNRRIEQEQR
jgi:DNA (cytosine-5)-methyltransferase 1